MKTLNKCLLAILYYNLLQDNRYSIDNKDDRKNALSSFRNYKKDLDKEILQRAYLLYAEIQQKEFDNLLATKCK